MNWVPLHCHSHFSLLDGLSKPRDIAERCRELGYSACAITDHGGICGVPPFLKEMKKAGLKGIAGCEFYICSKDSSIQDASNRALSHLCVLARGPKGWKNLMKASSASYQPENSYRKPRLDLERLAKFSHGTFVVFSGHMGSDLANICFKEPKMAYLAKSYEDAREMVAKDWKERVYGEISRYQRLFGKENFYLEIQLIDQQNLPASLVVARILRYAGKNLGVPCVATADSHYCRKEDAADQRVLLCSSMETTLGEVQRRLANHEDVGLASFFRSNNYHIPSLEEITQLHGEYPDEITNSEKISEMCEPFDISGTPRLPHFDSPDGKSPDEYLKSLCEDGLKKIDGGEAYSQRVWQVEYPVVTNAGLSSYFLIVRDYIEHAVTKLKSRVGLGRGSAAGCLISYLVGITHLDPIRFGLSFSRFYNAGRNAPGRIALPDIDTDFQISSRDKVVDYLRQKYGRNRVAQMCTFSRMQGRGALKDVLRVHERCSFEEMNRITEHIPDESEISDQLQVMMEETGEASIIRWALENHRNELAEWATLNEDGSIDGPLAVFFAQAIRLEGTKRNMGKHASGVIISDEKLADICPMVWDKSAEEMIVGVDMRDAEQMGLVKFDILGLRALDNISDAESIIKTGRIA